MAHHNASARAVRTLDCAKKVRIHYYLPSAIDPEALHSQFTGATLRIDPFSQRVANAKDHFVISSTQGFTISGTVGGLHIVATFLRLDDVPVENAIAQFNLGLKKSAALCKILMPTQPGS